LGRENGGLGKHLAFDAFWGCVRASKIRVVVKDQYSLRLGIQDKNSPGGTHPENLGGVCSERDNDKSVYTSLVLPALCSYLMKR